MTPSPPALPRRRFLARALAALAAGAWLGRAGKSDRAEAADQPYIGEIRLFAGTFAPSGWAFCHGQLLPINGNDALFSLIGTTYGGDGQTTFALPDLRGRAPIHMGMGTGGTNWQLGQTGGAEQVTLTLTQLPIHSHAAGASTAIGDSDDPAGRVPARNAAGSPAYGASPNSSFSDLAMLPAGGSSQHPNMQPYLCVHYIISLFGVFPSPS